MAAPAPSRPGDEPATPASPLLWLYRQLRDRHVLKTAGLYGVGAWGLIQVLATIQPALDLPPVLVTIAILLAFAGFLPACILAWAYDLTPPHILRAERLEGASRARPMAAMLAALAAVTFVLVGGLGWAVWRGHERGAVVAARAEAAQAAAAQYPPDHVAVLQFEELTPGKPHAYLAGALTTSLIDQLGRVPAIRVISRGGIGSYAGAQVSDDSIGRALHVGTIIKGSVLEDRGRIRVVVRAVDAATGEVLETSAPERPSGELLPLIDDIVDEVSGMIRERVGKAVEVREWQAGTANADAWRLLQQARQLRDDSDKLRGQGDNAGAMAVLRRADTLLAGAEKLDSRWTAPTVERGWIARKIAFLLFAPWQRDEAAAGAELRRGVALADAALARNPQGDPAAYELRGVLRWWQSFFAQGTGGGDGALLSAAEADLHLALSRDVHRSRAWATLSAVLLAKADWAGANAAATRAYEEDSYLEDAVEVVQRAYRSAFELGKDEDARRWCDELERRAAGAWPGAMCQLELMAWSPAVSPNPDAAWRIRDGVGGNDPPQLVDMYRNRVDMLVAAVLARTGAGDSARAVMERARARAPQDPEMLPLEAATRVLLRDHEGAAALLGRYAKAVPAAARWVIPGRAFRALRGDSGYLELVAR